MCKLFDDRYHEGHYEKSKGDNVHRCALKRELRALDGKRIGILIEPKGNPCDECRPGHQPEEQADQDRIQRQVRRKLLASKLLAQKRSVSVEERREEEQEYGWHD